MNQEKINHNAGMQTKCLICGLIDPNSDNFSFENWSSSNEIGTPGLINDSIQLFGDINNYSAEDVLKGAKLTKENDIDLIFLDIEMPVLNGFEATKQIKLLDKIKGVQTTIYALTASTKEKDRELCYEVGMELIISKPVTYLGFSNIIKSFLRNRDRI